MAHVVVFQHNDYEHPGRLGVTLRDHGFRLDIVRPDVDGEAAVPPDLDNVQGVVVMGGEQNVDEGHGWLRREIAFVRAAHEAQLPVIGVCLGAQVIAAALGGTVSKMAKPECGFCPVSLQHVAQTDRVMAGVPWDHYTFQTHGQEVSELPPGATPLATVGKNADGSKIQAFKAGLRTFAFQYHFEADRPLIDAFVRRNEAMFASAGLGLADVAKQAEEHYDRYARIGDRMSVNIVSFAFTFQELLRV